MPDFLAPPNGTFKSLTIQQLTQTVPTSSCCDTRCVRPEDSVHTHAARPYDSELALRITCKKVVHSKANKIRFTSSSVSNGTMHTTGPTGKVNNKPYIKIEKVSLSQETKCLFPQSCLNSYRVNPCVVKHFGPGINLIPSMDGHPNMDTRT